MERADAVEAGTPVAAAGPFVLNLCSSTTPMALPKAEQEELKRFSFFVSRRFEEGRERFRLHMGYFATLEEAEEWLGAVRDIYPGAWAGEAPGKKLRARAVAAAAAQAQHAAGPPPMASAGNATPARSRPASANVPAPPALPATPDLAHLNVPTLRAAAPTQQRTPARAVVAGQVAKPVAVAQPVAMKVAAAAAPVAAAAAVVSRSAVLKASVPTVAPGRPVQSRPSVPSAGARSSAPVMPPKVTAGTKNVAASGNGQTPRGVQGGANATLSPRASGPGAVGNQGAPAQRPGTKQPVKPVSRAGARQTLPNSNVREVLAALDDSDTTGETRMMPAPVFPARAATEDSSFTDTQVLKLLETRRADGSQQPVDVETGAISLLKPDDTGTREALKRAVTDNAPVWFAVQLQWSVQPVELSRVPPLAIFSAYTLYTVEGSREGRRWYGLRLGFFSDAISAKQVAYYVRSEFNSVAVVPVSPQERTRAADADHKAGPRLGVPKRMPSGPVDEFKLIDTDEVPVVTQAVAAAVRGAAPAPQAAASAASGKRNAKGSNRVRARERRGPQTLEETLEILGASELEIDSGNGETLNESGVRHLRVEVQKNTPFSRLLERLSERVRKP